MMILKIILLIVLITYIVIFLLYDLNWRCPFGHKWKYWQLIAGIKKSKRKVCTRCKIERGVKKIGKKYVYTIKYPKGEYAKYKDFAPIDSVIIKKAMLKHIKEKHIILNYRGHKILFRNY